MQVVPSGIALPFEVTSADGLSGLFAALKVYDVTSGSPGAAVTVPMTGVLGGSYFALFTPAANKAYLVTKGFYTDGTYATPDPTRSQGSDSFRAVPGALSAADLQAVAGAVWDALIADHAGAGSMGLALGGGGIDPSIITSAVWDAMPANHKISGSFGAIVFFPRIIDSDLTVAVESSDLTVSIDLEA